MIKVTLKKKNQLRVHLFHRKQQKEQQKNIKEQNDDHHLQLELKKIKWK